MNNINQLFLDRIKSYLDNDEYNKFIATLYEKPSNGLFLIKNKTNNTILKKIINIINGTILNEDNEIIYIKYDKYLLENNNVFIGNNVYHHSGIYYIQEPSANTVLSNITFNENEKILDLCASPGGKSIQTLVHIDNFKYSYLISNEIDFDRSQILKSNIERTGQKKSITINSNSNKLSEIFTNFFDKIILDAPCSGEGMMRKNEIAIKQWSKKLINNCSIVDKQLIDDCYKMLKNNGQIIYSTCTYATEENEDIIKYAKEKYPDLKIIEQKKIYHHMNIGEGQFFAILQKNNDDLVCENINKNLNFKPITKTNITNKELNIINDFIKKYINNDFLKYLNENNEILYKINNYIYIINKNFPLNCLNHINIIYAGICFGNIVKNIFKPNHSLSHSTYSQFFNQKIDLDETNSIKYLRGESLNVDTKFKGYAIVYFDNIPLGFVKINNGILKNHYPKGLRMN